MSAQFDQQIPRPSFASVRVEFTDGTVREFHVHKPVRADVTIPSPATRGMLDADLGALPPVLMPRALPSVEVRIKAGTSATRQVITIDTRAENPASLTGRMLALLSEAFDLRKTEDDDEGWRSWEHKAEALLRGEPR